MRILAFKMVEPFKDSFGIKHYVANVPKQSMLIQLVEKNYTCDFELRFLGNPHLETEPRHYVRIKFGDDISGVMPKGYAVYVGTYKCDLGIEYFIFELLNEDLPEITP